MSKSRHAADELTFDEKVALVTIPQIVSRYGGKTSSENTEMIECLAKVMLELRASTLKAFGK